MLSRPMDIEVQREEVATAEETGLSRSTMSTYPLRVEAIFIGSTAARRSFNQGRIGRVHSVFKRAFNILTSENRLISVVRADVGKGPINIVMNLPRYMDMTSIGVRRNHEVVKVDDLIMVGNDVLTISIKNAKQWKPRKDFRGNLVPNERIRDNLMTVKEVTCSYGSFSGLGQLIEYVKDEHSKTFASKELNFFARVALPRVVELLKAIRGRSSMEIRRNVEELIGFGPGLTPSADDLLLGLMTSLTLIAGNLGIDTEFVSRVNRDIVSCISGKTTLISQEFLMHAAVGEANEPIVTLIEKVLTADSNEVRSAAMDVLEIGEASGTDIVFGILLGAELLLDWVQCLGK